MKVKLTRISRFDKDKEGNPLVSKTGKPYTRVLINTEQHGEKPLSGFGNMQNSKWSQGDEVDIIVEENGQWLNFKTMPNTVTRQEYEALEKRVSALENGKPNEQVYSEAEPPPTEDDLPF